MRIGVLNNLRASHSNTKVSRMLSFLRAHPHIVHVETDNGDQVPDALAHLRRQEIEVIAVNGGDGTLQRVLTELLGNPLSQPLPLIAPLRGGRTNMNALDIGSHHNPVVALSALLEAAQNGSINQRLVERPVLRIDLGSDDAVQYGMFFSVGVIHRTIELKHRILPKKHFQGLLGSAAFTGALVTRAVFGPSNGLLVPDRVKICLDGRMLEASEFLCIMATTLNRLFLGLRPFWGKETAPIRLTALAAGAPRSVWGAIRILCGYPPAPGCQQKEREYTSRNAHRISFRLACGVVIDGELFPPQPARLVRIETDHRVRFVRS